MEKKMTKLEVIVRLAEMKGRLSHILLQEVHDIKKELIQLIDELAKSLMEEDHQDDPLCVHQWRLIADRLNPLGASVFCKLCGERDE